MTVGDGEVPERTCAACGGVAVVTGITRWSAHLVPVATAHHYRCTGCNRTFVTEPTWTFVRNLLGGIGSLALAAAVLADRGGHSENVAIGWMFVAGGVVAFVYAAVRRRITTRNPVRR